MRQSRTSLASASVLREIEPRRPHRLQASHNVAQTLAVGQLRKGHAEKLIATGEAGDLAIAAISADADVEGMLRQEVQQLRKNESSSMHEAILSRLNWKDHGQKRQAS